MSGHLTLKLPTGKPSVIQIQCRQYIHHSREMDPSSKAVERLGSVTLAPCNPNKSLTAITNGKGGGMG